VKKNTKSCCSSSVVVEDISFSTATSFPCRIMDGWDGAGKEGRYLGKFSVQGRNNWSIVIWDGEEDPDLHKTEGLELMVQKWAKASDA